MNDSYDQNRWLRPEKCIWGIVCHYPELIAKRKPLLMLRAYIDDSGKEGDSASHVLAGYMATAQEWANFTNDWADILKGANLSYFHMVDAWRLSRDYQELGVLGRNQLMQDLISCIKKHVQHAFVYSMDIKAFQHWFARNEKPELIVTRPYIISFSTTIFMIADHVHNLYQDEKIEIIFDQQGGESPSFLMSVLETMQTQLFFHNKHIQMPEISFKSDSGLPPLQAADLLAWLCRRENHNYQKGIDINNTAEHIWLDAALDVPNTLKIEGDKEFKFHAERFASLLQNNLSKKELSE